MKEPKDHSSSSSIQPATLHSPKITQTKQAQPMTADEILEAASPSVQESHWDAVINHIVLMGEGE